MFSGCNWLIHKAHDFFSTSKVNCKIFLIKNFPIYFRFPKIFKSFSHDSAPKHIYLKCTGTFISFLIFWGRLNLCSWIFTFVGTSLIVVVPTTLQFRKLDFKGLKMVRHLIIYEKIKYWSINEFQIQKNIIIG